MDFFQTVAVEDGARLGERGSEKRKWQNYSAKSEICASSLHQKAEFQHFLCLLIFLGLLYLSQRHAPAVRNLLCETRVL